MDNLNNNYWDKFYKNNTNEISKPSNFANFAFTYLPKDKSLKLLDLGCGNGRDLKFFMPYFDSFGLEVSETVVNQLKNEGMKNILFESMTNIEKFSDFDIFYSRFSLHALNHESICVFLSSLEKLKSNAYFLLETRSVKGTEYEKYQFYENDFRSPIGETHKRTLLSLEYIKSFISQEKFSIIYEGDVNGVAKFKEEDPYVIRLILQRK